MDDATRDHPEQSQEPFVFSPHDMHWVFRHNAFGAEWQDMANTILWKVHGRRPFPADDG